MSETTHAGQMADTAAEAVETGLAVAGAAGVSLGASPDFESRLAAVETAIARWAPAVEQVVDVAAAASQHQHSVWSILSAVADRFFGARLAPPQP